MAKKAATKKTAVKKKAAKKTVAKKATTKKKETASDSSTKKKTARKAVAKKTAEKPAEVKVEKAEPKKTKTKRAPAKAIESAPKPKKEPKKKIDSSMIKGGAKLTPEKLAAIKQTLLVKKAEVEGDVPGLIAEGLGNTSSNTNSPLHFAELGTDTYNQNFALGRLEREESVLQLIDDALERIKNNEFGLCAECGEPLRVARLEYVPWVANCVECQERLESY